MDKNEQTTTDKQNMNVAKAVVLWIKSAHERRFSRPGQIQSKTTRNCLCENQNEKEECCIPSCTKDRQD